MRPRRDSATYGPASYTPSNIRLGRCKHGNNHIHPLRIDADANTTVKWVQLSHGERGHPRYRQRDRA